MFFTTFLISMPGGSEWFLILIVIIPLYFLPSFVATTRKNPSAAGIFVLNLLLGWTFLGWIGALIWAFSGSNRPNPTIIVNNASQSPQVPSEQASTKMTTQQDKIDHLRQLKQLLDEGVLTTEEFNKQKAAILG